MNRWYLCVAISLLLARPALAGPPYVTDDPQPTDYKHYEIYAFNEGTRTHDGTSGTGGIDFNYGAAPDLQLTAVLPAGFNTPDGERTSWGLGNIELAAKYKFLHQDTFGWNACIFPRVFLPSSSSAVGERHASLLLPLWVGKEWGKWATFGGGGYVINHGDGSKNFFTTGWTVTRQVLPDLQLGMEIYHQTADTREGLARTGVGVGMLYDINETYHLLASLGPGIQNAKETNQASWYVALLFTY